MTADGSRPRRAPLPSEACAVPDNAAQPYQSLFEGIPVGLYRTTPDGRIIDANPALVRMFGYGSRAELLTRHAEELYADPQERGRRLRELEERGVVADGELRMRRRDGALIWVREHARVVRNAAGRATCYEGCLEDVTARRLAEEALQTQQAGLERQVAERTRELAAANQRLQAELAERRRTEQALRESKERFLELAANIHEAFWLYDPHTQEVLYASPACARIWGAELESLRTQGDGWQRAIHPEDRARVLADMERQQQGIVTEHEYRIVRTNGSVRWIRTRAFPVRDAHGQVRHVAGISEDVTERRETGELLRVQCDLGQAQATTTDLRDAAEQVLAAALRIPGIDCGSVYLCDETQGVSRLVAQRGLSPECANTHAHAARPTGSAELPEAGRPVCREIDEGNSVLHPRAEEGLRARIMVPVQYEERTVAALELASRTLDRIPERLRTMVETLAAGLGGVLARIQAQNALRASEEWFRTVVSASNDAIVAIDARGLVTIFNPAAEALFGYPRELVVGQPLDRLIPEPYRALHGEYVSTYMSTGRSRGALGRTMELPVVRQDGTIVPTEVTLSAGLREGTPFVLAVMRDITERKRAERELRQAQQRLDLALQGARVDLWDWHVLTGKLSLDTERWGATLGYAPGEFKPAFEDTLALMHEDDRSAVEQTLRAHLAGETPHFELECRVRTVSGDWRWLLSRGQVVERDAEGQPVRATGTVLDITERKHAEEAVRQHQEQLAHAARVATTGEMASGLAHELAQPLSAILYYAHGCAARLRAGTWTATEAASALEKIAGQAGRAGEFVRHLKAFVRRAAPQREKVDVNAAARAVLTLAGAELRRRRVEIDLELAVPAPVVAASAIELEQVLLNLIRNGCDALENEPEAQRRLLVRTWRAADDTVCVGVSDNGPGVRPADVEHLFAPFFTTKPAGLGLGLSISRSLIEASDGKLWYEPRTPRGATFGFTLPGARDTENGRA